MTTETSVAEPMTETGVKAERYLLTALAEDSQILGTLTKKIESHEATVVKADDLGRRRLAFPIKKKTELALLSIFFEADRSVIRGLQQELGQDESIKRFLLTTWSVDPNEERKTRSRVKKNVEEEKENV